MNQNNFLLTGANGFLAKILKKKLQKEGVKIYSLGRNKQDINADITKKIIFPPDLEIDIVIHAAGKAHSVPKSLEEEQEFFDVNFEGTKNLCAALEKSGLLPKAFVFISTVSVYGLDSGNRIPESYPLNGTTPYAKSKILAEEWLSKWCDINKVKLGVLRLPLVAGPNPPGNLGLMLSGLKSGKYLSIGAARAKKSVIWAEDIVDVIPRLIEKGGVYNLTDGYHPSFSELESVISKALGKGKPKKIPLWFATCLGYVGDIIGKRFPINSEKLKKITSSLTFDDTKAIKELDWNPSKVLDKINHLI